MISREATDPELRKREALEPIVRWWVNLPNRLEIIRSRHSLESASAVSAVLRASYLNGEAVSTEELAAKLGWSLDRVERERWTAIRKVSQAYKRENEDGIKKR